jgi:hypothetical protein
MANPPFAYFNLGAHEILILGIIPVVGLVVAIVLYFAMRDKSKDERED